MRKLVVVLGALVIFAFAAFAYGQQDGGNSDSGDYMGPGMMGGYGVGYGMGPGMMGGYGGGYGMGPGMMGGYGGGYGMGHGMMGSGYGRSNLWHKPECKKFLDDTVLLRKKLHDKRFEYMEIARDPKATGAQLAKVEKEIRELQRQIFHKAPLACQW
jgi:hypothetical protein